MTSPSSCELPTLWGLFRLWCFGEPALAAPHLALTRGDVGPGVLTRVRIQSECITSEVFGSRRCDCREQLEHSLETLADADAGILLYLRQEGRGIGITNKIRAYALQDGGLDTVDANLSLDLPVDARRYDDAIKMLRWFGTNEVELITNNPAKLDAFTGTGIRIVRRLSCGGTLGEQAAAYLRTKQDRLGHLEER